MKILISAYACEPDKGSEPAVGWHTAIEFSKLGHEVWVITRSNNKQVIENKFLTTRKPSNLHFLYYDLPDSILRLKKGNRFIHLYYFIWQMGAYKIAKNVHSLVYFDLVHHVTFVSVRQPSFMGNLGIKFVFGPVAGGEKAPFFLRFHYGIKGFFLDAVRDLLNFFIKFDPFMLMTFYKADTIYVTSEQTKRLIPYRFRPKVKIKLAIGFDNRQVIRPLPPKNKLGLRILYVGHFLYLKGMGLGLRAFKSYAKQFPEAQLTMVGKGPFEKKLRNISKRLCIENHIDWIPWVERFKLSEIYLKHDVLLFPSLHDSGGMVVLEAMSHGLPIICLDLGGPSIMIDNSCGIKIKVKRKSAQQVCDELASGLTKITYNKEEFKFLQRGAIEQAANYSWNKVVKNFIQN